jgi:hypothetical protein
VLIVLDNRKQVIADWLPTLAPWGASWNNGTEVLQWIVEPLSRVWDRAFI